MYPKISSTAKIIPDLRGCLQIALWGKRVVSSHVKNDVRL